MHRVVRASDLLCVGLVVALSLVFQQSGLGFYSDDWYMIAHFDLSRDRTLGGLFRTLYVEPLNHMRPGQILYLAGLYNAFGLNPLGYHLANAAVIIITGLLLYVVLRELGVPRSLSVAVPIVYAVLPHYTSARVWYSSFQACLSMALYVASLLAGLHSLRVPGWRARSLQALSLLAVLASTLSYEAVLPLFLLNAVVFARPGSHVKGRGGAGEPDRRSSLPLAAATVGVLCAVTVFKWLTSIRTVPPTAGYVGSLVSQALKINAWDYGLALPRTAWRAAHGVPAEALVIAAALFGASVWYLRRIMREGSGERLESGARCLVLWGGLVAVVAHAVLVVANIGLSATGANNRVAVGSALGVAMIWVGLAVWVARRIGGAARATVCTTLLAALATAFYIISARLVTSWVGAARQQALVLTELSRAFPTLPARTTLLLDGVCRYDGPGIVFEAPWDLSSALWLQHRDTTLRADVVSPSLVVADDGIHTVVYGEESIYPYTEPVILFDARHKAPHSIRNAGAARQYFAHFNPDRSSGCPPGRAGQGARVF